MAIGLIGTSDTEAALDTLFDTNVDEELVGGALIGCGSASAVGKVVAKARSREDGPLWFCNCMSHAFWCNNRRLVTEYYTYVSTAEIADYLEQAEKEIADKSAVVHALEAIDSENIRTLLRRWAKRAGSADDPIVREDDEVRMSRLCFRELMQLGDEFAIPYFVDDGADYEVHVAHENLSHFPSRTVARELRNRLEAATDKTTTVRLLALLGRFGDSRDADLILPLLDDEDDFVANVACESLLRLTDPMLVPERWREL